jgi:hypothetical protein
VMGVSLEEVIGNRLFLELSAPDTARGFGLGAELLSKRKSTIQIPRQPGCRRPAHPLAEKNPTTARPGRRRRAGGRVPGDRPDRRRRGCHPPARGPARGALTPRRQILGLPRRRGAGACGTRPVWSRRNARPDRNRFYPGPRPYPAPRKALNREGFLRYLRAGRRLLRRSPPGTRPAFGCWRTRPRRRTSARPIPWLSSIP